MMTKLANLPSKLRSKDIYKFLGYKGPSGVSHLINRGGLKATEDRKGWVIDKEDFLALYYAQHPEERPSNNSENPELPFLDLYQSQKEEIPVKSETKKDEEKNTAEMLMQLSLISNTLIVMTKTLVSIAERVGGIYGNH